MISESIIVTFIHQKSDFIKLADQWRSQEFAMDWLWLRSEGSAPNLRLLRRRQERLGSKRNKKLYWVCKWVTLIYI